jgi:hypothetical protein
VQEDEREPKKEPEPSVLPAREAIALIGQDPPESEPPDEESREPPTDVGGDPPRS